MGVGEKAVPIVPNLNLQAVNISLPTQVIPDYILAAPVSARTFI